MEITYDKGNTQDRGFWPLEVRRPYVRSHGNIFLKDHHEVYLHTKSQSSILNSL